MPPQRSDTPITPGHQSMYMPTCSGPLQDHWGRICTDCFWYKPWKHFWSQKQATCKECLEANGDPLGYKYSARRSNLSSLAARYGCRGQVSEGEWEDLKAHYDYHCVCCGRREPDIKLETDHVVRLSEGGDNTIDNIQPLCHACNMKKRGTNADFRPRPDNPSEGGSPVENSVPAC